MSAEPIAAPTPLAHHDLIKETLPAWLTGASSALRKAYLASAGTSLYSMLAAQARLAQLQSPLDFARPLLQAELTRLYPDVRVDVDQHVLVRTTYTSGIRLDGGVVTGELHATQQTLLEAALVNFEPHEAQRMEPSPGYAVILPVGEHRFDLDDNYKRTYRYHPSKVVGISAEGFAALCRSLDLGARYEEHVVRTLNPRMHSTQGVDNEADGVTADLLFSLRDELNVQAHIARMKGGVDDDAYQMLLAVSGPEPEKARWKGKPLSFCQVTLLDALGRLPYSLLGMAVIRCADTGACVVYRPGEPDHVFQQYASVDAFATALRARLRDSGYQTYFRRFVLRRDQVPFLKRLDDVLRPEPLFGGMRLPDPNANLDLKLTPQDTSLLRMLHQHMLSKVSIDARMAVVPTAIKNREEGYARLAYYLGMEMNALTLASFFVPGVGELMAVAGAVQLIDEVCIGVSEWRHHQRTEAVAHFIGVAENLAAVAATAGAAHVLQRSVFVRDMVVVKDGARPRLWYPDIKPYESPLALPIDARPNDLGQYEVAGRTYVRIEGRVYEQVRDPVSGHWEAVHPVDKTRYRPPLRDNGAGAWRHEHESALNWKGPRLLRRLGPLAEGLDDLALEQARLASGTPEEQVRDCLVNDRQPPALLGESLRRFQVDEQVETLIEGIREHVPIPSANSYPALLLVKLTGWPVEVGVRLTAEALPGTLYEAVAGQTTETVTITRQELEAGRLAERVVAQLSTTRQEQLFGSTVASSAQARTDVLGQRLADEARRERAAIFGSMDQARQPEPDEGAQALLEAFPELNASLARGIVGQATDAERGVLTATRQPPVVMAEAARLAIREARLGRAIDGFYRPQLLSTDTARLGVRGMSWLKGWTGKVRLELREGTTHGELLVSAGDGTDAERKYILRRGQRYQAMDEAGQELGNEQGLFAAILRALPDSEREALGLKVSDSDTLLAQLTQVVGEDRERASRTLGQVVEVAWMKPRTVRVEHIEYQGSGRGSSTPLERLRALYPGLSELDWATLKAEWRAQGKNLETHAMQMEQEYRVLDRSLADWTRQASSRVNEQGQAIVVPEQSRRQVAERIREVWRRESWHPSPLNFVPALTLDLRGMEVGELPVVVANFEHVQTLLLNDMSITSDAEAAALELFLRQFSNVRSVRLSGNRLTRVPTTLGQARELTFLDLEHNRISEASGGLEALRGASRLQQLLLQGNSLTLDARSLEILASCGDLRELAVENNAVRLDTHGFRRLASLRRLTYLRLGNNQITLTAESVEALVWVNGLRELDLRYNPLELAPRVTGMLRLQLLNLRNTGISQWPVGLTELMFDPGARLQALDLANNAIVEVPELAGSHFAEQYRLEDGGELDEDYSFSIANNPLSDQAHERLAAARLNPGPNGAGLVVDEDGLLAGERHQDRWLQGCPEPLLSSIRTLERDPEANHLFYVMRRLIETQEFRVRGDAALRDMWDVLKVLVAPTAEEASLGLVELRAQLFQLGEDAATTCGDGIALLLQRCKTLVTVWKAAATAASRGEQLPWGLLEVSRNLYRQSLLESVANDIYMSRSARRQLLLVEGETAPPLYPGDDLGDGDLRSHVPDRAEIMLKLKMSLGARLNLPEQYGGMIYEAYVSERVVAAAERDVKALERTKGRPGLKQWLVRQRYWTRYLEKINAERFDALLTWRADALECIEGLGELPASRTGTPPSGLVDELQLQLPGRLTVVDGVIQPVSLTEGERSRLMIWLGERFVLRQAALVLELTTPLLPN